MLLTTDALAQWFLERVPGSGKPWKELVRMECRHQFDSFVGKMREEKELRNDDVTVVIIESAPSVN
jgi:hypothetical protein